MDCLKFIEGQTAEELIGCWNMADLKDFARELNIAGRSKMNKAQLAMAIEDAAIDAVIDVADDNVIFTEPTPVEVTDANLTCYGEELLNKLLKSIGRDQDLQVGRLDKDVEDVALSTWATGWTMRENEAKIDILKNGGKAKFYYTELCYLDGKQTGAKLCHTKFGRSYRLETDEGVKWINPDVRPETLAKKGFKLVEYCEIKPAWAKLDGNGKGMAGMFSVFVNVYPSKINFWSNQKVKF
jgi:hypothetical protein